MSSPEQLWVPDACTLPTVDRPLRLAEFDHLFATALRQQERPSATRLRWTLEPAAEDLVRDLARRESTCCSFFAFAVVDDGETTTVTIDVPAEHVGVLDALQARAAAQLPV